MNIKRAGCSYRHPSGFTVNRPNGSGDHLLLIIKTEAFAVLEKKRQPVPPNSIVIFKKGTPQRYGANDSVYINDWIHFELDEGDERLFEKLGIPFDSILPLCDITELSGFVRSIFFERYSQNPHKNESMKRYFELLLIKLSERIQTQSSKKEHPYYIRFDTLRSEIRMSPQEDWSIDVICKKMMLSRSHVQHLYKMFFDTSISSDVQNSRMEHAKYLLSSTDMAVNAVSLSCGYDSDVHFMRLFKKSTGSTPTEYRRRSRSVHY
jgi:AraC family transcriptional regulator of arabinose operon